MLKSAGNPLPRLLSWLGGHELGILLAIGGIASGVWIFGVLADDVLDGGSQAFDRRLLLAMRRPGDLAPIGSRGVQQAARDITALGSIAVVGLITAIAAGFLLFDRKGRMAFFLCGSIAGGLIVSTLLKQVFQRPRPDIVPWAVYASDASFPSGHSMISAVTYLTLGALLARSHERRQIKAYILLIAVSLTFLIGVTRVYLGVHWPTDVLAGWAAGAVWASLCWLLAHWLQVHHTIEPETQQAGDSSPARE